MSDLLDLSSMSVKEMSLLQADLGREIERRKVEDKNKTLADLHQLASERGFSLTELLGAPVAELKSKRGGLRGKVAPQYANPQDPSQTWTGRGRKPGWVSDFLATGQELSALRNELSHS